MNKTLLRKSLIAVFFIVAGVAAFACEMNFTLEGQSSSINVLEGQSLNVLPGSKVNLVEGQSYKLMVEFNEDHRNCKIPASDTLFLLNGEKWRVNKETQPLILKNALQWEEVSKTKNVLIIEFTASVIGEQKLQIIRECSKGGYDETITFVVS